MMTTGTPRNTVIAQIDYMLPLSDGSERSRPYQSFVKPTRLLQEDNIVADAHDILVENIRGKEQFYTLDNAGFQYYTRPTKHTDLHDVNEVVEYYHENTELVKELTGASHVILFSPLICRHQRKGTPLTARQPTDRVQVETSPASSIAQAHFFLPSEAPYLLRGRFQIISLWRPINAPAYDWPLAFCTYGSVDHERDLFPMNPILPTCESSEALGAKYNPNHQWKYVRGMTPDEIVLIKTYDSIDDGSVARFAPRTAFDDPSTPKGSSLRESIELKFLVFYD